MDWNNFRKKELKIISWFNAKRVILFLVILTFSMMFGQYLHDNDYPFFIYVVYSLVAGFAYSYISVKYLKHEQELGKKSGRAR